ncbi:MAG: NAD-dependent epimerase/dehydratase family protein [Candidatus Cloacimonetes bacterium]|nr:NAD-dependent epimerase/dehydratase family protein [Candidatus Cloacimonadota bacterium]
MKILVTGGAGFIASHIVDKYIELGHDVVVVDNLSTGFMKNVNPQAKFYLQDIRHPDIEKIFKSEKPDIINHHAAQISVPISVDKPLIDIDVNIVGFLNILINSVKYDTQKVIFISSGGAIYGEAAEYPTTENYIPKPLSPYAINKYTSELYLTFYSQTQGLDFTTLRYSNVFGPRQVAEGEAGVVSIFIKKLLEDQIPTIYAYQDTPEGMIRDYIYIKDVVIANVMALNKASKEAINIGSGTETTTENLLRLISKQMKKKFNPFKEGPRPGDIKKSCLNIEKAMKILKWKPEYDLKKGLTETIDHFYKANLDNDHKSI